MQDVNRQRWRMGKLIYPGKLPARALRDVVRTILLDGEGVPMSTGEIASKCGTYKIQERLCGHHDCNDPEHIRHIRTASYQAQDIRNALKGLEKRGLAECLKPEGYRMYYWRPLGPEKVEVDAI